MSYTTKLTAMWTLALILVASFVFADVPHMINYQGRLTDAGGNPVPDDDYNMVFTIYDSESAPGGIWYSGIQSVHVEKGQFSYLLGSVNILPDTLFNDTLRWLGIKVDSDPEIDPRTRLVTVPYAFNAKNGGGWTNDGTNVRLITSSDFVGIGTTTPNEQLEITGNLRLPLSTASVGMIKSGEAPLIHCFGTDNTFIGRNAGNLTMTGTGGNTASGVEALTCNTTGYGNTASGYYALSSNTEGYNNTAIGWMALDRNTTGHHNTASGYQALEYNTTGDFNTASGVSALSNNTEGDRNTATGREALNRNITGNQNTATGADALNLNTTGNYNTANGVRALLFNTTGDGNTASGYYALYSDTTGSYNTAIGYHANVSTGNLTNTTAIGANAIVNASNKIRLGDAAVTVIEGQVAYTFSSDKNEKENFRPVDGDEVLRKIRELGVTSWNYKGQDPQQFRHYGPVAQEFFDAFGHDGVGTSGTPTTINSGDMAGILMIAVQTLEKRTAEVDKMKAENTELRVIMMSLQAEMVALRQELRKK